MDKEQRIRFAQRLARQQQARHTEMEMKERLAALAHNQWARWMEYLFSQCVINDDGSATIPAWAFVRWQRQMNTPYSELPDEEKESDRKEADVWRAAIQDHVCCV